VEQAADAFRRLESKRARGKVPIEIVWSGSDRVMPKASGSDLDGLLRLLGRLDEDA